MSGIAKELRRLRREHSKRLVDIARETGLSVSYLSDIERGHRAVFDTALATLNKILSCYGFEAVITIRSNVATNVAKPISEDPHSPS